MTLDTDPGHDAGPHFVGRRDELRVILDALEPQSRAVFHCSCAGGVGKTTLLRQVAIIARNRGTKVLQIDGRDLHGTPEAIEAAIVRAAGGIAASAAEAIAEAAPCLLLIDTLETIAPTLPWIFGELLAKLPAGVVVLLAGRDPLAARWRTDLDWAPRLRPIVLRNLGPQGSSELLSAYGVTPADHAEIFSFTLGHPLALTLIAESVRATGSRFAHVSTGDVVHELVVRFTRDIREPQRRRALEAACTVRVVTEPTLRALLEVDDSYSLFRWLRELSFFETVHDGLRPHENVRRAVIEDLKFRDPESYQGLRDRAHRYFEARTFETAERDEAVQIGHLYDLSYLHSRSPVAGRFFDWSSNHPIFEAQPSAREAAALEAEIERAEGSESVEWFRYWLERQPECCQVFRDQTLQVVGYQCAPVLTAAGLDAASSDPAISGARQIIARHGPLRGHEVAIVTRFWLSTTSYQQVGPVQSRMWLSMIRAYGITPHMAYSLACFHDVDFWEPAFVYMGFSRTPAGDYAVGGHAYGMMMHDWRSRPFRDWIQLLTRRENSLAPMAKVETVRSTAVLDRGTFANAVKDALRHRDDARALARNPLLETRLVCGDVGREASTPERVAHLRTQLDAACTALREAVGQDKQARAVTAAYGRGAPSQEAAAEALSVPLSSFRRHLKRGSEFVVQHLWEKEVGSGD